MFYAFLFLSLSRRYIPTRLWGFSGHIQTIIHSIVGRVKCPWPLGERVYLALTDGSTLTYDLYQPLITTVEGRWQFHIQIKPPLCARNGLMGFPAKLTLD